MSITVIPFDEGEAKLDWLAVNSATVFPGNATLGLPTIGGSVSLFKNGGGAHLDLMTSRYTLDAWKGQH